MIRADKIVKILKNKYNIGEIDYAIVVGSGLMDSIPNLEDVTIVEYKNLKMPKSKVKGHSGKFIFGKINNKNVVLVSRLHYYESGKMENVILPFKILSLLGTKNIILLTSCGGINKTFSVGDIMLIRDHINFTGQNPLVNIEPLEFTSMTNAYDKELFDKMKKIAEQNDINIRQGIHTQLLGPSYETMAEVEMLRNMGADTVSMSTVFDCIISNYFKFKACAIASVVNVFDKSDDNLSHEEVLLNAKKACNKIKIILSNFIKE